VTSLNSPSANVSWAKSIFRGSTREFSDSDRRRRPSVSSAELSSSAATTLQPKSRASSKEAPPLPQPRSSTLEPLPRRAVSAIRRRDCRVRPNRASPEKKSGACSSKDMNGDGYTKGQGAQPVSPEMQRDGREKG